MKFTVESTGAEKKLRAMKGFPRAIRFQMQDWLGQAVKHTVRNISGKILSVKTGYLKRNLSGRVMTANENKIEGALGTGIPPTANVLYAAIHEHGGRIVPRRAKYLTVPLPGVKGVARNYQNTFMITSKNGNKLICQRQGQRGLRPLFLLRKSVTIPAREWLSRSIEEMRPTLARLMSKEEIIKEAQRLGGE